MTFHATLEDALQDIAPTATVYLGRTARNELVFADVRISPETEQIVTFTDHTEGTSPAEIAISFTMFEGLKGDGDKGYTIDRIPERRLLASGQINAEERILIGEVNPAVRVVENAWAQFHLNRMNAACDHMTDDMLNPSDEALAVFEAEYGVNKWGQQLMDYRLAKVVCPVTGYRYGRSWLAKTINPGIIEELRDAINTLPKTVR